ncbi:FGGY-family carbohydrate kinase [Mucilaginibacter sp. L196]|uniref:FGGY-family carbohydrate kinase n=1 Tax=Mucilaginibacter sp. L196 TaxID=1641870 RepID=UPI00131BEF30|nr:FGGY family carbohydrate kinase [Mucilaginibacter sp. L196]
MSAIPVIAIFDVGKTNKKLFLFDENYHIVYEKSARFIETVDEDGDPCENLESLELSVFDSLREVFKLTEFEVKAINFSTYGASFVHINAAGKPVAPLYNYLKEFPEDLKEKFYKTYGGETKLARETCSPVLGNLNSGMQLYRIKHKNPQLFNQIQYSLHLPQYLSYLLSGVPCTDITSIGCHTGLWDFEKNDYHYWVSAEGLTEKFAPIIPSNGTFSANKLGNGIPVGVGLHDSSAALIPYLVNFSEPFILISTGTWCISLNPFNHSPITDDELANDCLCYMQYKGSPVKASRLFAGNEHELQVKRIASHFNVNTSILKHVEYDPITINKLTDHSDNQIQSSRHQSAFVNRDLSAFANYTEAYHQLIIDIMEQQYQSTKLALKGTKVNRIFVDGGFSKNSIYMNLLAKAFPELEVFAASMAQATAVGAAIAIHRNWNSKTLPADIIELKYYSTPQHTAI